MENQKTFYQSLPNLDGFSWVGYWDKLHHFTKKIGNIYTHIQANEQDIKTGNLNDMIKHNLTR